jgi:hypothetical protein
MIAILETNDPGRRGIALKPNARIGHLALTFADSTVPPEPGQLWL